MSHGFARTALSLVSGTDFPTVAALGDLNPVWPSVADGVGVYVGGDSASLLSTVAVASPVTLLAACTVSQVRIWVNAGGSTGALARIEGVGLNTIDRKHGRYDVAVARVTRQIDRIGEYAQVIRKIRSNCRVRVLAGVANCLF